MSKAFIAEFKVEAAKLVPWIQTTLTAKRLRR